MFNEHNPGHPFEESYFLAGLIYPVLPLYEDFEVDESTGKTISEGMALGIDPTVRFRLIDRRGKQYYYCRQWAKLRREERSSIKNSAMLRRGMYAGIPREMIEKTVINALEKITANSDELTEGMLAFINKYVARITIDAAGNMIIRVRFHARPQAGCYVGRWINGSTLFQKLGALGGADFETSVEIIRRPELGNQISRLYDVLLTDELEGVKL